MKRSIGGVAAFAMISVIYIPANSALASPIDEDDGSVITAVTVSAEVPTSDAFSVPATLNGGDVIEQRQHQLDVKASQAAQAKFVERRKAEIEAARKAAEEAAKRAAEEAARQAAIAAAARQPSSSGYSSVGQQYSGTSNGYSGGYTGGSSGYQSRSSGGATYTVNSSGTYSAWDAQAGADNNDIITSSWNGRTIIAGHSSGSAGQFSNFRSGDTVNVPGQGTYKITNTVRVPRGSTFEDIPQGTAFQTCEDGQLVLGYGEKIG